MTNNKGVQLPYLRAWRTRRGLSQPQLAGMAGVTRHTILNLELGRYGASKTWIIPALSTALGITQEELVHINPTRSGWRPRLVKQSIKSASIRYALDWHTLISKREIS